MSSDTGGGEWCWGFLLIYLFLHAEDGTRALHVQVRWLLHPQLWEL
jgi:hypothetical protein